jgi:hypothetical protein
MEKACGAGVEGRLDVMVALDPPCAKLAAGSNNIKQTCNRFLISV